MPGSTITGTAPTTCPNSGLPPTQLLVQRVYHKDGSSMTYYERAAGSMTYHPSHGHMHVDDWGIFTLRSATQDPDPLNWPIVGNGAKLAFCLMDYGSCNTYLGHCVDSLGNTLSSVDFPNYGLGGDPQAPGRGRIAGRPVTMTLEARLPLHGTTDFGLDWDDPQLAHHQAGNLCPICGRLIHDESRYCTRHSKMLDYLRPKIQRLIELARERRHAHH